MRLLLSGQSHELLDVRPIEPRNRFETIMGAYGRLAPGQTLELVVDHDPRCMYYTLLHDHGPEAFGNVARERFAAREGMRGG